MNNITTLENVFNRVDALSQNCFDQNVNVNDLSFDNLDSVSIAGESHPLKTIAQRSITWRLGIPFQYLRKCPPEIQSLNLNYWIEHEKNEQLFFRFDGREVRAIFTPKYKPVDNFEVCERLDSMGYGPDTQVQCSLDPGFMSLSILDGKKAFEINGDKFKPGISISNSEVGLGIFVDSCIYPQVGLHKWNGFKDRNHLHPTVMYQPRSWMSSRRPWTKFPYELGAQKHKIGLSMESPVDDPMKTIESFNRQFNLNQPQKEAVEWAWPQEMGDNMFAVVNTYTRASQFKDLSAENSYQLQRVGGNILGMLN